MYINNKDHKKVIGNITINVGDALNLDNNEDAYIVCRDMNVGEALTFKTIKDDEISQYEEFRKVLPNLMVEHNFYEDEEQTKKMSNEGVVDVLFETWFVAQYIYNSFLQFMFRKVR